MSIGQLCCVCILRCIVFTFHSTLVSLLVRSKVVLHMHRGVARGNKYQFLDGWYCLTVSWSDPTLSMEWIMSSSPPRKLVLCPIFLPQHTVLVNFSLFMVCENTDWRLHWSQSSWHKDAWYLLLNILFLFSFALRKQILFGLKKKAM